MSVQGDFYQALIGDAPYLAAVPKTFWNLALESQQPNYAVFRTMDHDAYPDLDSIGNEGRVLIQLDVYSSSMTQAEAGGSAAITALDSSTLILSSAPSRRDWYDFEAELFRYSVTFFLFY